MTSVQQSGHITPFHPAVWAANGVIADGDVLGAAQQVLASIKGANFNTTGDQPIVIPLHIKEFQITSIIVTNASVSMNTAAGGFYSAASKGGFKIVSDSQIYSSISSPITSLLQLTLTPFVSNTQLSSANLGTISGFLAIWFSLSIVQGAPATADIYLVGVDLSDSSQAGGANPFIPMTLWTAAKAAVYAGTRNAKIVFMGDSTTAGFGGAVLGYPGALPFSYPTQLAALMLKSGLQTFTGTNNVSTGGGPTQNVYDTRFSAYSANWGPQSGTLGTSFLSNNADTTALAFTPTLAFDTIDFYSPAQSGMGVFTVDVDGGVPLATVNQDNGGAAAYVKTTVSCSPGTHTINFKRVSGTVYIGAFVAYTASVKQISFQIAGWAGGKALNLSDELFSNAYTSIGALEGQAPDLTVLCCTINDWQANTSLATYVPDIQRIITAAKLSGDVLMMSGFPTEAVVTPIAQQQKFIAAYAALAVSNNLNFLNLTGFFGSWESANANGWTYDSSHPNALGYGQIATALAAYL